jgi:hypothetical protein
LKGIERVGIFRSNVGETFYLYYNPATHTLVFSDSTPVDAGSTG